MRLRLQAELGLRQIKGSLRLSLGAIQKAAGRAHELELDWVAIDALDDQQLARLICPASDLQHFTPNPVDVTRTNSQQIKNPKEKECIYLININVRNVKVDSQIFYSSGRVPPNGDACTHQLANSAADSRHV